MPEGQCDLKLLIQLPRTQIIWLRTEISTKAHQSCRLNYRNTKRSDWPVAELLVQL
jgi:hypothetical protein